MSTGGHGKTALPDASESRVRYRAVDVGSRLGRFELVELLGEGGMATVFRARDSSLRRDVAVKVLFPHLARRAEVVSRFQREARAAAALDHANILRVIDVGGGPDTALEGGAHEPPFMVLELIDGSSLSDLLPDQRPLLAESVAAIGAIICRALSHAHAAGIIHRDIKPANVMITDEGRIVIADFGVARVDHEDSVVTRTGAILGTPAYMSPEQASAADELDARSDLYSVGATLYRLGTGQMPFTGSPVKVVTSILTGNFVPPLRRAPAVGPDLAHVIGKLMSTDRDGRYADAAAAEAALLGVLEDAGVSLEDGLANAVSGENDTDLRESALVATLDRAERAVDGGRVPRAIALADRALALDPRNQRALAIIEAISAGRRRGWVRWALAAAALLAAGTGAAIAAGVHEREATTEGMSSPIVAVRPLVLDAGVIASPADAMTEMSETAAQAPDAGKVIRDRSPDRRTGPDPRDVKPDAGAAIRPVLAPDAGARVGPIDPPKPRMGKLKVTFAAACDLSINGVPKERLLKFKTIDLPAGDVTVTCKNPEMGMDQLRSVKIRPGAMTKVAFVHKVTVTVGGDAAGVKVGANFYAKGKTFQANVGRLRYGVRSGTEERFGAADILKSCVLNAPAQSCD